MKIIIASIVCFLIFTGSEAQQLLQAFRGNVTDELTGQPLEGASVQVTGPPGEFTTASGTDGWFSLSLPVGRYKLTVTFTGFGTYRDEILIVAGKELVMNVTLVAGSTVLEAIEVQSAASVPETPGLRSLSIEKTLRIPANFFDPVRVVTSYPGVVSANDQGNAIIIRGNSPNGLLWRLNDLDIVNPNHLSNAGMMSDRPAANGGGVNILSAQMLDRTDFYTGVMPVQYGNALSGVIDMKLREGNKAKYEFTGQASLIGLDFAAEGPLSKSGNSSFIANYRYSTVGLLSALGVNFGDEDITFQDFAFSTDIGLKNDGKLSVFGFWGYSENNFEKKDSAEWEEDKDRYDILYEGETYAAGIRYEVAVNDGKVSIGSAYSHSGQHRAATISQQVDWPEKNLLYDLYDNDKAIFSNHVRYSRALSEKTSLNAGVMLNFVSDDRNIRSLVACYNCSSGDLDIIDFDQNYFLLQPYAGLSVRLSEVVSVEAGIRYMDDSRTGVKDAVDPRLVLSVKPAASSRLDIGYNIVSQTAPAALAFPPKFIRSHRGEISYWQHLSESAKLNVGTYYHDLFNVPVSVFDTSAYSLINLIDETPVPGLTSAGSGRNYGADMSVEKYFFGSTYLMLTASYYQSKFTAADGIERDTRFNGNYTFSGVYGKEWTKSSRNRTIGLNTRVLYLGGLRESPVDIDASMDKGTTVYDLGNPFSQKLDDYFRIDLRLSFRKDKPGYTRTFAIDIQNLTNQLNPAYHYYDKVQGDIVLKNQLGIIPVLVYRVDF